MIREESEPEVIPINPPSTSKLSSTATKSSKSHSYSLQASNNQSAKTATKEAERKEKVTLKMITNLLLKRQKSNPREALPDLKPVKSPTPVPMEGLLCWR